MQGPQENTKERKRRSQRNGHTGTKPETTPSTDGKQNIPVPKAMQRAQQNGSQQPVRHNTASQQPIIRGTRQGAWGGYDASMLAAAENAQAQRMATGGQMPVPPHAVSQPVPNQMPAGFGMSGSMQPMNRPNMAGQMPQGFQQGWQAAPNQGFMQGNQAGFGRGYVPPTPPNKGGNRRKNGGGGGKKPLMIRHLVIAALVIVIVASLAIGGKTIKEQSDLRASVTAYNSLYCPGVYVDGIHLGGMTQAQAAETVLNQAHQRNNDWSVKLTYQGQLVTELNAGQLGMTVDVQDALEAAWYKGHQGTVEERRAEMDALEQSPFHAYSALPSGDTSIVDALLASIQEQAYRAPQDAYLESFNPNSSNPFTFVEAVQGRWVDIAPIKTRIYEMLSTMESGTIDIVPQYIEAQVKVADLEPTVKLRSSAYTEISTSSEEGRNNNIRRAFEQISGTVLAPGKTFSFNGTVGERSLANGFFEAPEIAYNEMTTGVGGGVCQASTTLYQAVVKAGLKVTDHTPHSEKVNYTDYGLDATVYWYSNHRIDFKFLNNTEGNIYIVCSVQSNPNNRKRLIAKVDIYGMDLGGMKYDFVSELVEELPYESETRKDKKKQYVNYTDESFTLQEGRDGCVYQSYRVALVDGKEVEREPVFKDTYKPRKEIIYVGTTERPLDEFF